MDGIGSPREHMRGRNLLIVELFRAFDLLHSRADTMVILLLSHEQNSSKRLFTPLLRAPMLDNGFHYCSGMSITFALHQFDFPCLVTQLTHNLCPPGVVHDMQEPEWNEAAMFWLDPVSSPLSSPKVGVSRSKSGSFSSGLSSLSLSGSVEKHQAGSGSSSAAGSAPPASSVKGQASPTGALVRCKIYDVGLLNEDDGLAN